MSLLILIKRINNIAASSSTGGQRQTIDPRWKLLGVTAAISYAGVIRIRFEGLLSGRLATPRLSVAHYSDENTPESQDHTSTQLPV